MQINKENIDDLNAVLKVTVNQEDYKKKVDDTLKTYRKKANIPGFRKGMAPMGFIKKQYEKAIVFEQVNQLLQDSLNNYLKDENISILGNPLPRVQEDINWDDKELNFEFDLGIQPDFDIDLKNIKIKNYKVAVNKEELNKYIENFSKRYGTQKEIDAVKENSILRTLLTHSSQEKPLEFYVNLEELPAPKEFIGKKKGDKIKDSAKNIFKTKEQLDNYINGDSAPIWDSESPIETEVVSIVELESAPIDQVLFDKVYGEGVVEGEEAFRNKVKEESEKMYSQETDALFLNETLENLVENTKFDLPKDFLIKWLSQNNDISVAEAEKQYEQMQKGLRYQLIQSKLTDKYNISVSQEDVNETARKFIKNQFAAYGNIVNDDAFLNEMLTRTLTNKEERERMVDRAFSEKLLALFKKEIDPAEEEVSFDKFVEIITKKEEKIKELK